MSYINSEKTEKLLNHPMCINDNGVTITSGIVFGVGFQLQQVVDDIRSGKIKMNDVNEVYKTLLDIFDGIAFTELYYNQKNLLATYMETVRSEMDRALKSKEFLNEKGKFDHTLELGIDTDSAEKTVRKKTEIYQPNLEIALSEIASKFMLLKLTPMDEKDGVIKVSYDVNDVDTKFKNFIRSRVTDERKDNPDKHPYTMDNKNKYNQQSNETDYGAKPLHIIDINKVTINPAKNPADSKKRVYALPQTYTNIFSFNKAELKDICGGGKIPFSDLSTNGKNWYTIIHANILTNTEFQIIKNMASADDNSFTSISVTEALDLAKKLGSIYTTKDASGRDKDNAYSADDKKLAAACRDVLSDAKVNYISRDSVNGKANSAYEYVGYHTISASSTEQFTLAHVEKCENGTITFKQNDNSYSGNKLPSDISSEYSTNHDVDFKYTYSKHYGEANNLCILHGIEFGQPQNVEDALMVKNVPSNNETSPDEQPEEVHDVGQNTAQSEINPDADVSEYMQDEHAGLRLDDAEKKFSNSQIEKDKDSEKDELSNEDLRAFYNVNPMEDFREQDKEMDVGTDTSTSKRDTDINSVYDDLLQYMNDHPMADKDDIGKHLDKLIYSVDSKVGRYGSYGNSIDRSVTGSDLRSLKQTLSKQGVLAFKHQLDEVLSPSGLGVDVNTKMKSENDAKKPQARDYNLSDFSGQFATGDSSKEKYNTTDLTEKLGAMLSDKPQYFVDAVRKIYQKLCTAAYAQQRYSDDSIPLTEQFVRKLCDKNSLGNDELTSYANRDKEISNSMRATDITKEKEEHVHQLQRKIPNHRLSRSSARQAISDFETDVCGTMIALIDKINIPLGHGHIAAKNSFERSLGGNTYGDDERIAFTNTSNDHYLWNMLIGNLGSEATHISSTANDYVADNEKSRNAILKFANKDDYIDTAANNANALQQQLGNYAQTLANKSNDLKNASNVDVKIDGNAMKMNFGSLFDHDADDYKKLASNLVVNRVSKSASLEAIENAISLIQRVNNIIQMYNSDYRDKANEGNFGTWNTDYQNEYSKHIADYNSELDPARKSARGALCVLDARKILDSLPEVLLSNCSLAINILYRAGKAYIDRGNQSDNVKLNDYDLMERFRLLWKVEYVRQNIEDDDSYDKYLTYNTNACVSRNSVYQSEYSQTGSHSAALNKVKPTFDKNRALILNSMNSDNDDVARFWNILYGKTGIRHLNTNDENKMYTAYTQISKKAAGGMDDSMMELVKKATDSIITDNQLIAAYASFLPDIESGITDILRTLSTDTLSSGVYTVNGQYRGANSSAQRDYNLFDKDSPSARELISFMNKLPDDAVIEMSAILARNHFTSLVDRRELVNDFYNLFTNKPVFRSLLDRQADIAAQKNQSHFLGTMTDVKFELIRTLVNRIVTDRKRGHEFAKKLISAYNGIGDIQRVYGDDVTLKDGRTVDINDIIGSFDPATGDIGYIVKQTKRTSGSEKDMIKNNELDDEPRQSIYDNNSIRILQNMYEDKSIYRKKDSANKIAECLHNGDYDSAFLIMLARGLSKSGPGFSSDDVVPSFGHSRPDIKKFVDDMLDEHVRYYIEQYHIYERAKETLRIGKTEHGDPLKVGDRKKLTNKVNKIEKMFAKLNVDKLNQIVDDLFEEGTVGIDVYKSMQELLDIYHASDLAKIAQAVGSDSNTDIAMRGVNTSVMQNGV